MSKSALLVFAGIAGAFLMGAATQHKPVRWKHKCERPFNFDELTKMIEAREEQNWEMITVSPVVMAPPQGAQEASAYLRYVACFKRIATDD